MTASGPEGDFCAWIISQFDVVGFVSRTSGIPIVVRSNRKRWTEACRRSVAIP